MQTYPDFLYNRIGPLFNSLLLPWFVLGFALALVAWRTRRIFWILALFVLFFFVAPVVFHAAFGRAFYAELPAACFLMALGSVACYAKLKRVLGPALRPALRTAAIVAICFVGLGNLYMYFNEVDDPYDREMRREIMEIARSVEDPALLALYPYFAETGEPFEFEREYLIALGHRLSSSGAANPTPYRALAMEQLLPTLAAPPAGIERAMVVWWNWDNLPRNEERLAILTQLQTCYPAMTHLKGLHFDRYIIPNLQPGAPCVAGFARNVP